MKSEWKNITKEILEQEFANGLWHKEIAEKYEVSSRAVYDKVKKLNVDIERKNKKEDIILQTCSQCGKQYKKLEGDLCYNCVALKKNLENAEYIEPQTDLGKQVIKLRKQGLSNKKIAKQLSCSTSTVAYYCTDKSRKSIKKRIEKYKTKEPWKFYFRRRVSAFRNRTYDTTPYHKCKDWNKKFRTAVSEFKHKGTYMENYTYHEALKHVGGTQTQCYLTGTPINILTDDYQLDHILPVSKGGTNELSNMAIATIEANQMKGGLTNEELFYWCQKILEHNGYTVIKNENIETQSE